MARGAISSAQLETVVYAGMRFQHQLPTGALAGARAPAASLRASACPAAQQALAAANFRLSRR